MDYYGITCLLTIALFVMVIGGCLIKSMLFSSDKEFAIWFTQTASSTALMMIASKIMHLDVSNAQTFDVFLRSLMNAAGVEFILFVVVCGLGKFLLSLNSKRN